MITLRSSPIGVFDSGIGGLTVFRALREAMPHEDFIYLGDTARLPYGTKSKEVVEQYAIGAARFLREEGIKYLVVACNTASAHALGALQEAMPDLPYCGVIAAGAEAALKATQTKNIAVLATEGTIRSRAYADVIRSLNADAKVQGLPCNLLVALAEEGWSEGPEAEAIISRYLSQLEPGYDTLLLGCTHFPFLIPTFRKLAPAGVHIVDSATVTAKYVSNLLRARDALNPQKGQGMDSFFVTDLPERFERIGKFFLDRPVSDVTQIDFPMFDAETAVRDVAIA